jgi:hypothetical protein
MKKLVCVIFFGATAALVGAASSACSSTSTSSASGDGGDNEASAPGDAGTKETGGEDSASDGAAGCNTITNGAAESTTSTKKSTAPAATGGTIVDGEYYLDEFNIYEPMGTASAATPSGLKVTLVIKGNLMQSAQELPDGATDTFSETFTVSGTKLDRTLTCPKAAPDLAAVYSVNGSKLTIYETDPKSMLVAESIYTKQ